LSRSPAIFTIGHSNHPLVKFLELLTRHGLEKVVDVRSTPHSLFVPHFNKKRLDAALHDSGIDYLHLGHCLGGRPKDRQFYDENGHVQYDRLALSKEFRECIDRLLTSIPLARIALLCGEENPSRCHRRLLITPVLVARGVDVAHIRGDGRLESEESLAESEQRREISDQPSLFE
jgi:uncharacterized protein (DUF488 family)